MKKLTFILKVLVIQVITFSMFSCNINENETQPNVEKDYDVLINSIETSKNENPTLYGFNSPNMEEFDFTTKNLVKGSLNPETRSSYYNKECVYFNSKNRDDRIVALYVDKTYGIEKSAIFDYKIVEGELLVTAYDLNNNKLFDVNVDISNQIGVISNVYNANEIQTRINACNAAMYAAGAPWSVGFGMVHPIAGLLAATVFWALEHAVC